MSTNVPKRGCDIPLYSPHTPAEYIADQQEANVVLTSLHELLVRAQNYPRSRSLREAGPQVKGEE